MYKIACQTSDFLRNTGSNSQFLPGPAAMLIAVDKTFSFTLADLNGGGLDFFLAASHDIGVAKVFPMFGNQIPVDYLSNSDTSDITATTDRGAIIFLQYGFIVKTFGTLAGGLCYAKALQSFNNTKVCFIEIDSTGRMTVKDNGDGTFGGMPTTQVFAPKLKSADMKNPAQVTLQVSYDPSIFVNKGKIIVGGVELLDMMGLIDLKLSQSTVNTIALIHANLKDECCGDDMVSQLGVDLLDPTNFIVTDNADNSVTTITSVTAAGEVLTLHGTFVTAHSYHVTGAGSDVLFGNDIEGFDIIDGFDAVIP